MRKTRRLWREKKRNAGLDKNAYHETSLSRAQGSLACAPFSPATLLFFERQDAGLRASLVGRVMVDDDDDAVACAQSEHTGRGGGLLCAGELTQRLSPRTAGDDARSKGMQSVPELLRNDALLSGAKRPYAQTRRFIAEPRADVRVERVVVRESDAHAPGLGQDIYLYTRARYIRTARDAARLAHAAQSSSLSSSA